VDYAFFITSQLSRAKLTLGIYLVTLPSKIGRLPGGYLLAAALEEDDGREEDYERHEYPVRSRLVRPAVNHFTNLEPLYTFNRLQALRPACRPASASAPAFNHQSQHSVIRIRFGHHGQIVESDVTRCTACGRARRQLLRGGYF